MRGVPWWGWIIIAIFALNVLNSGGSSFFTVLMIGMITFAIVNQRRSGSGNGVGRGHASRGRRPVDPLAGPSSHGGMSGTPAGQQGQPLPDQPLPRIDVPAYPGEFSSPTSTPGASPTSPGATSNDPVISLAQLHLNRLSRELHEAASRASTTEVNRLLAEIGDLVRRMTDTVSGTYAPAGSGRKEFESALRALEREVEAAQAERQPGPAVHRVVRTCRSIGETGRHE